jgi:hypothetical protein
LPDGSFSFRDVGRAVCEMLGLREGETVEILRDRSNPDRLMIVRHGQEQKPS